MVELFACKVRNLKKVSDSLVCPTRLSSTLIGRTSCLPNQTLDHVDFTATLIPNLLLVHYHTPHHRGKPDPRISIYLPNCTARSRFMKCNHCRSVFNPLARYFSSVGLIAHVNTKIIPDLAMHFNFQWLFSLLKLLLP